MLRFLGRLRRFRPLEQLPIKTPYVHLGAAGRAKHDFIAKLLSPCWFFLRTYPLLQGRLAAPLGHLGTRTPEGRADQSPCFHAYAMSGSDTAGAMGGALVGRPRQVKIVDRIRGIDGRKYSHPPAEAPPCVPSVRC